MNGDLDQVRAARAALALLTATGDRDVHTLVAACGPVDALSRMIDGTAPGRALVQLRERVNGDQLRAHAARVGADARRVGARVVIPEDDEWPTRLPDLATVDVDAAAGAAVCLWVRGHGPLSAVLDRAVAVVGAHAASPYGTTVGTDLGYSLATAGATIATRGAYGIDTAVLRGALAVSDARTVVITACGLDRPHPAGNTALLDQVTTNGSLVSAYPPGVRPSRDRMTATGQLLATLTRGIVVVEAAPHSRTLTTLEHALSLGRLAMVVPGPVTSTLSAGVHEALRRHPQLRVVRDAADVLHDLTAAQQPGQ
ncbi:DNA-processing protein DprA [Rugosimonospora africana]|uniref:Smf/DprA SLOG domain-containing protein n=1 Tax=Rugosimonospora africana TaxID=556532 RepID=A0A8J3VS28_9ACTN|nr:DNA-processing protein DprA [Rugosimonospora africana]GIH16121.1 hypothetical protein Raf01_42930 [Rugosimonospora africana]